MLVSLALRTGRQAGFSYGAAAIVSENKKKEARMQNWINPRYGDHRIL